MYKLKGAVDSCHSQKGVFLKKNPQKNAQKTPETKTNQKNSQNKKTTKKP